MFLANKLNKGGGAGGYQISRSLRFNSADSAYLNRTPASATNRKTWTYSAWVKLSNLASSRVTLLEQNLASSDTAFLLVSIAPDAQSNNLIIEGYNTVFRRTTASYRDFSAWYHIVVAVDTTQATANNRIRLYINNVEVTAFGTLNNPTQNDDTGINSTGAGYIGREVVGSAYSNAYMTEINLIDGTQLTPSSFGETNAQTGVWQPKAYSGSYGTNGFYLNFSDNSNTTAATLGADYSGNGNNWTPNNFSVTAGAGNDSLVDSPTSYGTDTGVGGEVRGNYCTLNPLVQRWDVYTASITNGNLDTADTVGDANNPYVFGTTLVSSGKFYWEITVTAIGTSAASFFIGVDSGKTQNGATFTDWVSYSGNGSKYVGSTSSSAYGATYTTGDVIGVALDKDAGTVTFYKNNTSQGAISLPTNVPMVAWLSPGANSGSATANFGQRPFAYTAPSGFKALCTQNLPTPTIGATSATQANTFFTPNVYAGNNGTQTVTNSIDTTNGGGLVWFKNRTSALTHYLINSGSGYTKYLASNNTDAEGTFDFGFTPSTTGFSFTQSSATLNATGSNYVAWQWKANGSGSTNTAGSITSTVSANTTSGFSVVTYTGNGSAGQTIGHGLGVAPSFYFIKQRNGSTYAWIAYHSALGANKYLLLNTTNAGTTDTDMWNNTAPTSSVFSLSGSGGNAVITNPNTGTMVAYCFAPVAGYSAFGSYTGNGSADGPFVYTGFRPAFVLFKRTDATSDWWMYDTKRSPSNEIQIILWPNYADAEGTGASIAIDILSNGFKPRSSNATFNGTGGTYIFMAFAESPQKFSLAR